MSVKDLSTPGDPLLTYSHHSELHILLHNDMPIGLRQEEGAAEGAAVRPRVIEGDVLKVNGTSQNILIGRPMPQQAVTEVFVEDGGNGVVVVEYLRERKRQTTRSIILFPTMQNRTEDIKTVK